MTFNNKCKMIKFFMRNWSKNSNMYNKKFKIQCIIIIFILNLFLEINIYFLKEKTKKLKVCLCTLGKKENRYIREYVEHYKKYDVDKIYLYDNNDINGEKFEDVIDDYINKGYVEIFNWRGQILPIFKIMNDCYIRNYEKYDWLIFYELDEFIHLSGFKSVKSFLNKKRFKKCPVIYLNFVYHTDNNLLYYENKSLAERFPILEPLKKGGKPPEVKSILRGHVPNIKLECLHRFNYGLENCNGFGHKNKAHGLSNTDPDYKYYYIDHYYSKSTEEFINKINRGDAFKSTIGYTMLRVYKYYKQSNFTKEKIEMIENQTGLNLSIYRKKLHIE